jgi:hypothetical protein
VQLCCFQFSPALLPSIPIRQICTLSPDKTCVRTLKAFFFHLIRRQIYLAVDWGTNESCATLRWFYIDFQRRFGPKDRISEKFSFNTNCERSPCTRFQHVALWVGGRGINVFALIGFLSRRYRIEKRRALLTSSFLRWVSAYNQNVNFPDFSKFSSLVTHAFSGTRHNLKAFFILICYAKQAKNLT